MADVTGPISTLPGAAHPTPEGTMCDFHPDRLAVTRLQGETDSMGCEMHDVCRECAEEHRAESRNRTGNCEWCEAKDVPVTDARDYEEGTSGRVYQVCKACKERQAKRLQAEAQQYDGHNDYDERDAWCDRCQGLGSVSCYCGGDNCVCEHNGEMDCPSCGF